MFIKIVIALASSVVARVFGLVDRHCWAPAVEPSQLPTLLSRLPTPATDDEETWLVYLCDFNPVHTTHACPSSIYTDSDDTVSRSSIPVFVIPGDDEWNDCPNPDVAWDHWTSTFGGPYNVKHWPPPQGYTVTRQESGTVHNSALAYRRVLHVGLKMVGGYVHDESKWDVRLAANLVWIETNVGMHRADVDVVLIYGKGMNPGAGRRNAFYTHLSTLVRDVIDMPTVIIFDRVGSFGVEVGALGRGEVCNDERTRTTMAFDEDGLR